MQGRKTVQGIFLDLTKLNEVCVNKAALAGMENLRMLRLSTTRDGYVRSTSKDCTQIVTGSGDLKISNKLRVLVWHGYPLESLPSDMTTKNLIRIDMRNSNLKQLWKETKVCTTHVSHFQSGFCSHIPLSLIDICFPYAILTVFAEFSTHGFKLL